MHDVLAGVSDLGFFTEGFCVSKSTNEEATDTSWPVVTSTLY